MNVITLLPPVAAMLPEYTAALQAGWSPNTTRDVSGAQLAHIQADPDGFLRSLDEHTAAPITLGDGRVVPRLPGPILWIWDGAFCGSINLRYQEGTLDLPPHVSGHVGYAVVPWKRRRGVATEALQLILPIAAARGLPKVLVTCDEGNIASRGVIERAGGVWSGRAAGPEPGSPDKLLYWLATREV